MKVSVVMPVYNGKKYMTYALNSILAQTFTDWELIVVNEFDSVDGSYELINEYIKKDRRIKLIQNTTKLGLAESLNEGIRHAEGDYIARMDADDWSHPMRFEKQVAYLDLHPNVGVLGTWQHHFGKRDWYHCPPRYSDKCMATLLFDCNLCHSTVMMRKRTIEEYNLFYDPQYSIEDFELWSRFMAYGEIVNIPEVLGEYRESDSNISNDKMEKINVDSIEIVAKSLKRYFNLELDEKEKSFFVLFDDPFKFCTTEEKNSILEDLKFLLNKIFIINKSVRFCNDAVMLHVLYCVWNRAVNRKMYFNEKIKDFNGIEDIFLPYNK